MKLGMEAKQITPEFWLVTLYLSEHGKMDNVREFIVGEQQLAYLRTIAENFQVPTAVSPGVLQGKAGDI